MARLRGSPRFASRHDRGEFQTGFQMRDPNDIVVRFGPWAGVVMTEKPRERVIIPGQKDELTSIVNGLITKHGTIGLPWEVESVGTYHATNTFIPAGSYDFGSWGMLHIVSASGTRFDVVRREFSGTTTYSIDGAPKGTHTHQERVAFDIIKWGNKLYFAQEGMSGITELDTTVPSSSQVASSPDSCELLFLLGNNAVAVQNKDDLVTVFWSVDGSPDDWSGEGSGSSPRINLVPPLCGAAIGPDSAIIISRIGAVRIESTGTIPPFRFNDVIAIPGGSMNPPYGAVAAPNGMVFYVDLSGELKAFDGQVSHAVGRGRAPTTTRVTGFNFGTQLMYSRQLDKIIWSGVPEVAGNEGKIAFVIDYNTLEVVGSFRPGLSSVDNAFSSHKEMHYVTDRLLADNNRGIEITYGDGSTYGASFFDMTGLTRGMPGWMTPYHDFGSEVWVKHVDLFFTDPDTPADTYKDIRVFLGRQDWTGSEELVLDADTDGRAMYDGAVFRFPINSSARWIAIGKKGSYQVQNSDSWYADLGLRMLEVVAQVVSNDEEITRR